MGLDVYLYHCEDRKAFEKWSKEREAMDEKLFDTVRLKGLKPEKLKKMPDTAGLPFGPSRSDTEASTYNAYRNLPQEEQDARRKAQEEAMRVWDDEHPSPCEETEIRLDSKKKPDHMFKIGYLRSSYNDGGFNHVIPNLIGGQGLYDIFEPDDEYSFTPDWKACLKRAKAMRAKLLRSVEVSGPLGCMKLSPPLVSGITHHFPGGQTYKFPETEAEAISRYREEQERKAENAKKYPQTAGFGEEGYSNLGGHWYPKGFEAVAFLHGFEKAYGVGEMQHVVYVLYKNEELGWYMDALEITVEMIEYVLAQKDPEHYYVHWSG